MSFNLDLPYVVDNDDRKVPMFKNNQTISISILRTAYNTVRNAGSANGIKDEDRMRIAADLVDKVAIAKNEGHKALDLNENELKHVHDLLTEWLEAGIPQALAGYYRVFREEIEKKIKEAKEARAAKEGAAVAKATA